jgi:hypothetical protein
VQVYRGDPIDHAALLAISRAVIANNRAGGWRRIHRGTAGAVPFLRSSAAERYDHQSGGMPPVTAPGGRT